MKDNETLIFELKLVVIGTLLMLYWQIFPSIVQPIDFSGYYLNFSLIKIISMGLGVIWFLVLVVGVYCLATNLKNKKTLKMFTNCFNYSSTIMIVFVIAVLAAYGTLYILALKDILLASI